MKYVPSPVVVLVIAGLLLGAPPIYAQTEDVRAAVEAGNRAWIAAFTRGDSQGIANLYTTTALAFPPQGDIVRGREAIARLWQLTPGSKG